MFHPRVVTAALTAAALVVPAAGAQADGPVDVTGMSASTASFVDASTGLPGPVGVHAIAILGGPTYQTYDEIALQVRPVGGEWDPTLTFPHAVAPVSFGGYMTTMLSTTRSFAPGAYEARVAFRQGETWAPDEALLAFTMP
jgi:hypothetical protein